MRKLHDEKTSPIVVVRVIVLHHGISRAHVQIEAATVEFTRRSVVKGFVMLDDDVVHVPRPDADGTALFRVAEPTVFVGDAAFDYSAVNVGKDDAASRVLSFYADESNFGSFLRR